MITDLLNFCFYKNTIRSTLHVEKYKIKNLPKTSKNNLNISYFYSFVSIISKFLMKINQRRKMYSCKKKMKLYFWKIIVLCISFENVSR